MRTKDIYNNKDSINKMGNKLLLFFALLLIIPFVNAEIDTNNVQDVFQINSDISYTKPCFNNGSYCSAATICNYTFYDMDNSIINNNIQSDQVGNHGASIWQKNFTREATGLYKVDMICIDGGEQGAETLYYQVTGDGGNNSIGFFLILFGISIIIIVGGFLITDGWIVMIGSFGLYFIAFWILKFGIAGYKDAVYTWAPGLIILAMAFYISIKSGLEMLDND